MARYEDDLNAYSVSPLGVLNNGGEWPEPKYQFSLIACARWESRYLVEWLTYHRSIGVEHVYLYCNDDDPAEMYRAVLPFVGGNDPFVTFRHYSLQGLQFQMYFHALRLYSHETKWLMFLDIDEFVCIRGSNDLPAFMSRFPQEVDAVYFNWCSFGNNGHATRPAGDVLVNYTKRERSVTPFTKVFIKSQSVPYRAFYNWDVAPVMHDYTGLNASLRVVSVLGEDIGWYYENFPSRAWPHLLEGDRSERMLATAFIAHYNIKSDEDFVLRAKRGLKGDYAAEKMWSEKNEQERLEHHASTNAVPDSYLHDYWKTLTDGWKTAIFPRSDWPIVSEGKDATQISTAHQRSVAEDAAMIVSGRINGRSQNHTELAKNPWWVLDLGKPFQIHEMRLFNRLDGANLDRVAQFRLDSSLDGRNWAVRHAKTDPTVYGGADGTPYRWVDSTGFEARWLRLTIPGESCYLHFDQVQFFGVG